MRPNHIVMKKLYLVILFTAVFLSGISAQSSAHKLSTDSLIVSALAMVNTDSLQADVQEMQNMVTRFMIAPNRKEVATWIMNKFLSYGITEVRLDSFLCNTDINYPNLVYDTTTWQYNVEARIEGTEYTEDEVVLLGHYDDCTTDFSPMIFAPGADDNASGTAATLECARVIMEMGYQPGQTLIFLASAAEELMYYGDAGTEHYAQEALAAGRNIVMAINNDMIAWDDGSWTIDLFNHPLSSHITGLAIDIIDNYTSLDYYSWPPVANVGGDIQPFFNAGYYGVYFMEHVFNPNYHTYNDLVVSCDFPYLAEVTKVSLGCLLKSDITVGQKEIELTLKEIMVYPNPANTEISFYLNDPRSSSWELKIHNLNGAEIYKGQFPPGNNSLDVSSLPEGFYMMIFSDGTQIRYQKLVIVR
jgi:hypothetical protein